MSRSMTHPGRLVSVVAIAAVVTIALVLVGQRVAVSATPLPDIAADELLASVAAALESPPPVSGEIEASLDLGLPTLPIEGADHGPLAAFSGDQRLRVWRSEDGLRVAHLLEAAERALIVSRDEVWTWNSSTAEATRIPLPETGEGSHGWPLGYPSMGPGQMDPTAIAGQALAAIDDSTAVSVGRTGRVAGRDTYQLIVEPRTAATLIGRIELDLDAEERLPLRAAVFARGAQAPSLEVGYRSVSFAPIDPTTFDFTPPPGSTVTERPAGHGDEGPVPSEVGVPLTQRPSREPKVIGEGWATVVAINQIAEATTENAEGESVSALEALGLALPFSGPLFSARIEDVAGHSFLLVGAVDQSTLEAAASSLP